MRSEVGVFEKVKEGGGNALREIEFQTKVI